VCLLCEYFVPGGIRVVLGSGMGAIIFVSTYYMFLVSPLDGVVLESHWMHVVTLVVQRTRVISSQGTYFMFRGQC